MHVKGDFERYSIITYLQTFSGSSVRITPCNDRDFWKPPSNFHRFLMILWRLLNVAKSFWRGSIVLWALLKLFKTQQCWHFFYLIRTRCHHSGPVWKMNWIFVINHVLKNNSLGFVSQVWEMVLDAWDRRL